MNNWNVPRVASLVAITAVALGGLAGPSAATVPPPSGDRILVGGTEHVINKESALGRPVDVVRTYASWSPTSLPVLDLARLRGLTGGGQRSLFVSAVIPWLAWKAEADQANGDGNPANDLPVPYCKWKPTHPVTGQPLAKSWFGAFADGDYDARLRTWLTGVDSLGAQGDNPVFVSLMSEMDRLDALPGTVRYRACVGTPDEFKAGWARAHAVAGGATGGASLNHADGTGGRLIWVPVFTGWAFNYTAGYEAPERPLVVFKTGLPPPGAPPNEQTLEIARATPWMPPTGTWDQVGIDEFNFSGAIAGRTVPARIKVDDPATQKVETDQWRSLDVLMQPVLLWSTHHAPMPDGTPGTVFLAEVGSVPDPTRPDRRPDWIKDGCVYLDAQPRIVGSLYFDTNTVRLSTWAWTKHADGSWHAGPNPTGTDHASVAAWGELMASPRAGGTTACGEIVPPPGDHEWVGNGGVEDSLVGWSGKYGAAPIVTRTSGGHDSSWAITVRATAASPTSAGVSDQPRWMTSTVAGTEYVASAWVRAETTGQRLVLQLREWDGATLVATAKLEWRATGTEWHEITVPLTAARSGSSLSYAVYSPYIASPQTFSTDDLSLTSASD